MANLESSLPTLEAEDRPLEDEVATTVEGVEAESQNSDAMSAFTPFFHAEAEASKTREILDKIHCSKAHLPSTLEELATRKEAHAFHKMVQAEQRLSHSCPSSFQNMSLDNRGQSHSPYDGHSCNPQPPPSHARGLRHPAGSPGSFTGVRPSPRSNPDPPRMVAQVIAEANTEALASTPFTTAPSSPGSAIDQGADISDLITEAEHMDLEATACCHGLTPEELLGRVILVCSLLVNVLTLLVLLAAINTMTLQVPAVGDS
ncbi:hypothetical protein F4604DRAFT_1689085 [Suillus subluteus]|nr:hypothetical protein F4604DRAFT_1689085 [Suillus subluteus]